jgi:hypothetical protein
VKFDFAGSEEERHALLKKLMGGGAKISAFNVEQASLQDVYMSLAHRKKGS